MKKQYLIVAAGILLFASALVFTGTGDTKALNVNDVAPDPLAYTGVITVTGIMAVVSQEDPSLFGIMDKSELQCTTPDCSKFYLPVSYQGSTPAVGDEVVVSGRFTQEGRGVIFVAETVKILRNHNIGM
ncbi:hypothetical protein dsat_0485 [Alkalidesulfovibrio alkalitolerans DSM 16529]|jgi:hypothetical protein|uniref:Nucleic acid binding OB-fold tRNA/helicase-type n=1 Tax=Alkalidesulfovibrio alkalitolerans DSM 16529 TaxID=1121439 RepID=S7UGT6_9BACT|nr:hypothetical protein [Alkalidesulfovibrio alkalitolerans]EPR33044.1 hypothetical protein dsat_0485 [Alkalidesulfovibrio alkalitolerans DSM 16529]